MRRILRVLAQKLRLEGSFDFASLARATPGYVGADLQALITQAGVIAVKRIFKNLRSITMKRTAEEENESSMDIDTTTANDTVQPIMTTSVEEFESQTPLEQLRSIADFIHNHKEPLTPEQLELLSITEEDFRHALSKVQPSSKREGFATVPDVSWDDIGALSFVRDELRMAVVEPINHPEFFERVGITAPAGVLLWGPPGCGKTLLAKAVANESNTNFISVKGPELLNKVSYVTRKCDPFLIITHIISMWVRVSEVYARCLQEHELLLRVSSFLMNWMPCAPVEMISRYVLVKSDK